MKKFFTLIATVLCALGANAQSLTVTWADGLNGVADPSSSASDIQCNVGDGFTTLSDPKSFADVSFAAFQPVSSDKGSNSYASATSMNKYVEYTFTPQSGSFTATKVSFDIIKIGTGDPTMFVDIIDGEGTVTHIADNAAIRRNNDEDTTPITHSYNVSSATSSNAFAIRIYAGKLANNKQIGIANVIIEGTMISADAPILGVSKNAVTLRATPWQRTSSAEVVVSGKNLTDGTYSISVPSVSGLSVDPAQFTVSGGEVNQTVTISYTSEEDVEAATATIEFAVDNLKAEVEATYSSKGSLTELAATAADATWNFENITETIDLSEETIPTKNDWVVYADYEQLTFPGAFKSKAIAFKGQYPIRNKKVQNGTLKIKTTQPGTLTIDFSDTGSSGDNPAERYLAINNNIDLVIDGENEPQQVYTQRDGSSDRKTVENICVMPGEITIAGKLLEPDVNGSLSVAICVYKVTFTVDTSITKGTEPIEDEVVGISEISARQADRAVYTIAGQQVKKAVKGLYIQNGKKFIVK